MTRKLQKGDKIAVISPSSSAKKLGDSMDLAKVKFEELGYTIKYQNHIFECDTLFSSSLESRLEDFHDAFKDNEVKAILSAIGGFNCNDLLDYIDYDVIKENPKILCGYSDITALLNAIYAKTGLITYLGPHYSSFAMKLGFDYTLEYFHKLLTSKEPYVIKESEKWSDEAWFIDQNNRTFFTNEGWKIYNEGDVEGTLIGGNLNTFNLLQGTPYMPDLSGTILLIEDTGEVYKESSPYEFNRNLQSLIHCHGFDGVQAIIIARQQIGSEFPESLLLSILDSKKELANIPIIYDVDFGHTTPILTFPIGGKARLKAMDNNIELLIYNTK